MNINLTAKYIPILLILLLFFSLFVYIIKASDIKKGLEEIPKETSSKTAKSQLLPTIAKTKSQEELVSLARKDLAQRLVVSQSEISTKSVESVVWNDASLGCPQKGMYYAQVLTDGYRIILEVEGKEYAYHTSLKNLTLCNSSNISCDSCQKTRNIPRFK